MSEDKTLIEGMYTNRRWSRAGYGEPIAQQTTSIGPNVNPHPNSPNLFNNTNLEVDNCANLFGWQQQLVGLLGNINRPDIYILSQPGSGKTAPVICHWINNVVGLSTSGPINLNQLINFITNPENIPQVLWLVPIRNLGVNIEEETVERFTSIILQIINRTGGTIPDPTNGNSINLVFNNPNLDIRVIIKALSDKRGGEQISNSILHMIDNVTNQVSSGKVSEFKTGLAQLVRNFVEHALVGRIQEQWNKTKDNKTQKIKPFIISIYESAKNIINDFTNLKLIIFDEAQRIQGGTEDDDTRAAQIGESVHKILFNKNGRAAQIVMLSGSTSKATASNVTHFFNSAYARKFAPIPYQTPENVTNPSDIRVFPMANLNDKYSQLRIIQTILAGKNIRKDGVVFIIFGKERINNIIDELAPAEQGFVHPGKKLQITKGVIYNKLDIPDITRPGSINEIDDDRLRRAASHGIGYLYRPDELTPAREKDTKIIQRLFKEGIIKILFATDAIREGMNITCREMYIPTILLPPNNREMDAGSLAQLINRIGRKEGVYATIYTDPKFVGDITQALSKDSDRFGEQPFILPKNSYGKVEAGLNYGINISVKSAKELGKALLRII